MTFNDLYTLKPWQLVSIYSEGYLSGHMWAETAISIYKYDSRPSSFSLSKHNSVKNLVAYCTLKAKQSRGYK